MRKLLQLLTSLSLLVILLPMQGLAQQRTISGTVKGENQAPLEGVTVGVKNTNRITQTDANGHFSIQASTGETLEITYVGYAAQEIKIGSGSVYPVTMGAAGTNMNEVVVTALGIKRQQ